MRSKSVDLLRKKSRRAVSCLDDAVHSGFDPQGDSPDSVDEYKRHWEKSLLQTALSALRPRVSDLNFQLLQMRVIENRSESDVAAELNLKPEQVRDRKHRMLKLLKAELARFTGKDV